MYNMSDDDRKAILGEFLMEELHLIREYLADIPMIKRDIADIKGKIIEIEVRLTTCEDMYRAHEKDIRRHDTDITYLKQRCA